MSAVGLEVLLERLIDEIAFSGEKGVSISFLFKIIRRYHNSQNATDSKPRENEAEAPGAQTQAQDGDAEPALTEAEMVLARLGWDWLRSRPEILINGDKRWNKLQLSEVLALPEVPEPGASSDQTQPPPQKTNAKKGKDGKTKSKQALTVRPRIYPSEELVWNTLTRHGVDYKRVPLLEWKCLLGIASVRGEGILQSDLRRLVDQDKRSLPKRTDSLAKKGYIVKRTIVVSRMKTSKLWLIDFAPPILEKEVGGLDLSVENLTKDLEPVAWHERWTGNNIDMEAFGRTFVGIIKAWGVIRYSDLRYKMGICGKHWQMKTLAKNSQRFVDMGVLKYTAATFPGSRKVFKDCLKFLRDPRPEEWDRFLATGKKTSQYSDATRNREPKPNALAVYASDGQKKDAGKSDKKSPRIFDTWSPEKPLSQSVFEVVKSTGPEGASNPQVSVATVGYAFRRYMSSHLTKLSEMQQPEHLKKFQVTSTLVRSGKTSAYMYSAKYPNGVEEKITDGEAAEQAQESSTTANNPFGFGEIRPRVFASRDKTILDLNKMACKSGGSLKRKDRPIGRMAGMNKELVSESPKNATPKPKRGRPPKKTEAEINGSAEAAASVEAVVDEVPPEQPAPEEPEQIAEVAEPRQPGAYFGKPGSLNPYKTRGRPKASIVITIYSEKLKDPNFLNQPRGPPTAEPDITEEAATPGPTNDASTISVELNPGQTPQPEETEEEVDGDGEAALEQSASSRGGRGGRGRGRGPGRGGRGGRGRGVRKGQAYPGAPFKCDTCGGTWKNDIGLKYHLTKAKVPCNPNFDPNALAEKRRHMSPIPPTPSAASEADGDENGEPKTRSRRTRRGAPARGKAKAGAPVSRAKARKKAHGKLLRSAPRPILGSTRVFRGLIGMDAMSGLSIPKDEGTIYNTQSESPSKPEKMDQTNQQPIPAGSTPPRKDGPMKISFLIGGEQGGPSVEETAVSEPLTDAGSNVDGEGDRSMETVPNEQTADLIPNANDAQQGFQVAVPEVPADPAPVGDDRQERVTAPLPVAANTTQRSPRKRKHADQENGDVNDGARAGRGKLATTDAVMKPFQPSAHYDMLATEAKKRTAQAYDIIIFLLDNCHGVFPGDKALFFAVIKVFLNEFRGQAPPTWKNCHAAIKALETRNIARVHTHMLRTENGKLATLSLMVKVGVEPMGPASLSIRQKMRDTYPTLYIPPAFSPTKEELDFLQELDGKSAGKTAKAVKPNANGEKFRARRRIDEVEVFNAPYYTQTANEHTTEYRDPFWDRGKHGDLRGQKRASEGIFDTPSKRMRGNDAEDVATRLAGEEDYDDVDGVESPFVEHGALNDAAPQARAEEDSAAGSQELEPQADVLLPFGAKRRRFKRRAPNEQLRKTKAQLASESMMPTANIWKTGSPSVAEAVKAYNLLPARPGKRGRPRIHPGPKKMTRIQPHLGKMRNPGLNTLPPTFFAGPSNFGASIGENEKQSGKPSGPVLDNSELTPLPWMKDSYPEEAYLAPKYRAESFEDVDYGKFNEYLHRSMTWELAKAGTAFCTEPRAAPGSVWVNFSPPVSKCNMKSVNPRWAEDRRFMLETMPYQDLEEIAGDDSEIPVDNGDSQAEPRPAKKRRLNTIPRRRNGIGGRPSKFKLQAIKTGRELTPYPTSNADFLRAPGDDKDSDIDWTTEQTKLTAFVVVCTILGGVDKVVDWGLMMRLYPDMTISQLRHAWCALKKDRQSTIVALTEEFRSAFLKAYASGELRPIDFNNTLAYDWKHLIKWTTQLNGVERILLPATHRNLSEKYVLSNCKFENREWRESYYHPQRSVFNRFQDSCSEPVSYPAEVEEKTLNSKLSADLKLSVAMSWTRSLCVTPVDLYSTDRILKKRNNLLPGLSRSEITDLILQGIDQLQREGIISKSTAKWSNGRRWRFNNRVPEVLDKMCNDERLAQAVEFKEELDAKLRPVPGDDPSTPRVKRIPYVTKDGMIMALLNLQAEGRVRIEHVGQPNVPMGHEPGNYETRKYTKKYLHFRLDIHPTDKYLFNEDDEIASLRKRLEEAAPPTRGAGGATPAWCDVFEKVDMNRWLKYLSMVLNMVAARGAMPPDELAKTLKPVIMVFEVEMILEWGKKLGILGSQMEEVVADGRTGEVKKVGTALAAREWWWFAVDAQRRRGIKEGSLTAEGKRLTTVLEGVNEGEVEGEGDGHGENDDADVEDAVDESRLESSSSSNPLGAQQKVLGLGEDK